MRPKLIAFSIIFFVHSAAFAGATANLPANTRLFLNEEDCVQVIQSHYSWNIEFAAQLRDMESGGKLVRYPLKVPITIVETKMYKSHKYYKISIFNSQTKQNDTFWTDAVKFE